MKQRSRLGTWLITALLLAPFISCAQQRVDNDFTPRVTTPLYEQGKGPVMLVDAGHHNFHTLDDKFAPFGKVATLDGFQVRSNPGTIDSVVLKGARILVIANALNEKNTESWKQPVYPAFTPEEIEAISNWVWQGGRLFLIADHMPFPGAVADLASTMGFTMYDGFALRGPNKPPDVFSYNNGMLKHSALTDMHGPLDSIVSFTGQAFKIPDSATSVTAFDTSYKVLMPEVAWEFSKDTKMIPAAGLSQLAYSKYGQGKIVVSGEAAMFTAQTAGGNKMGLNAPIARNNVALLLNIFEWLSK